VDLSSFKVVRATHDLFATAVRNALPGMRFYPAELGDRKVRQVVQQPFAFTIRK
jgi:protein TonB